MLFFDVTLKFDAYVRAKLAMEAEEIKVEEYLEKIEQAELKGKIDGKLEIAKQMLVDGEPIDKIMKFTKLSREQILSINKV